MPDTPGPTLDSPAERVRAVRMLESLSALLDQVRGAREVLPHLAALEAGLARQGLAAIDTIPPAWRARLCAQLSSLPLPEGDAPLQDLQSRLLATLTPVPPVAGADTGHMVLVSEVSHSEFMAVSGAQAPPADRAG